MPGKKQVTARNAQHTKENRGFSLAFLAFLAVTMQFMGAMSDEGKQLHYIMVIHNYDGPGQDHRL